LISRDEYVLNRVKVFLDWKAKINEKVNPLRLDTLISQWEFDYENDKQYQPEALEFDTQYESRWKGE